MIDATVILAFWIAVVAIVFALVIWGMLINPTHPPNRTTE